MRLKNRKRKGINLENKIRRKLEKRFPLVVRSSASKFPDLVAIGEIILLMEVKTTITKQDLKQMKNLVRRILKQSPELAVKLRGVVANGTKEYVIYRPEGGKIKIKEYYA